MKGRVPAGGWQDRAERAERHLPLHGGGWEGAVQSAKGLAVEKITLATIARRLGLSKFAVSRALSGKSGVSEATRRRVQDLAAELGYVRLAPPAQTKTLGLVFHDTDLINSELHL